MASRPLRPRYVNSSHSMEAGNYAVVQVAEALAKSGNKLVPDVIAGGGDAKSGTLVDVLLAGLIRENIQKAG